MTESRDRSPATRMTLEQRAWCKLYKDETTFEPLMDDFLAGNKSFLEAARFSVRWFGGWSSDAHLNISRNIPGADEDEVARSSTTTNGQMKHRIRKAKTTFVEVPEGYDAICGNCGFPFTFKNSKFCRAQDYERYCTIGCQEEAASTPTTTRQP